MLKLGWLVVFVLISLSCNKGPRRNIAFYSKLISEPSTLNPITSTDGPASSVQSYVLETLLENDINTYEWKPSLAEKWEISQDKTEFIFYLKKGVKFHDGVEMTAKDVKYSFDVFFDEKWHAAHKRFLYENFKGVEIIDKYTVKFTVKTKVYSNFDIAASLTILPKHFYEAGHKKSVYNKNLMGTGPYKLENYYRGNRVVLNKNNKWWGRKDKSNNNSWNFNKIVLRWTDDETVALEMLKKGRFDYIGMRPDVFMKKAVGKEWGNTVHKVKTRNNVPKSYCFIGWNLTNPILKSKTARKALFHLVNRRLMIEKFEFGMATPAIGPIYPDSPYASKDLKPVEFNPKKALRMLRSIGWKDTDGDNILDKVINGKKTKFEITIMEPSGTYMKYLTVFKEDAKKAGVLINLKQIEWNSFLKVVTQEKKFDACRLCWSASVDWDPKQIWHSSSIKGGSNFIGYSNKEVDRRIDKARLVFDRAERIKLLQVVERQIIDDAPYVFMSYRPDTLYGHTDRIIKEEDTYNYGIGAQYWKFKESKLSKE